MIQAICGKCKHVFWAAVVMGKIKCPGCGSEDTYVALWREDDDRKRRTGIK